MFKLFRHIKNKKMLVEPIIGDYNVYNIPIQPNIQDYKNINNIVNETSRQPTNNLDCKMNRLMELVGIAIETWAKEYHMEKLPKKILFEQALDAMRTIEFAMNSREY